MQRAFSPASAGLAQVSLDGKTLALHLAGARLRSVYAGRSHPLPAVVCCRRRPTAFSGLACACSVAPRLLYASENAVGRRLGRDGGWGVAWALLPLAHPSVAWALPQSLRAGALVVLTTPTARAVCALGLARRTLGLACFAAGRRCALTLAKRQAGAKACYRKIVS